ncbi:MAG: acyloxyacyl hydrolase [Oleiphilaceae bacterium]|nr:acyloxyacyl hydrolase [Oleiphilaceae bacterium]
MFVASGYRILTGARPAGLLLAFILSLTATVPALAGSGSAHSGQSLDVPLIQFNVGQVGIDKHLEEPWRYELQYRFAPRTPYRLVPSLSIAWANNDANYLAAELRRDFRLNGPWLLTPSFGVGRFNNRLNLDLGKALEFRSGLELSYQSDAGYRLGAAIFHLSNGSLSDKNPGTETLVVTFTSPVSLLGRLFRR